MSSMSEYRGELVTTAWARYERGRSYNSRLTPNQYELVNTNIEFFAGNQWRGLEDTPAMRKLPKPTFNIIKRITSLFVASLTSSASTISFDDLAYYGTQATGDGVSPLTAPDHRQPGARWSDSVRGDTPSPSDGDEPSGAEIATAEVQNLLEKFKMDFRIRDALFDGAQTGDYCAHFWWDAQSVPYGGAFGEARGEIRMELVDGINVMFGNPNTTDVESQPYILIVGRDTVANLKAEAEAHKKDGEPDGLQPDADTTDMAGQGGRVELDPDDKDGKALFVYMYEKRRRKKKRDGEDGEDGTTGGDEITVHVTKATKGAVIYEDVDTGLSRYPIAWGNWEKQKNQYHGRALVTGVIPNQIFINKMFAMVMQHLTLMGFPKTVYNADLIGHWSNEVGQVVGVRGLQPGQRIADAAYNLQVSDMSAAIWSTIDKAISYTKDCLGATDAQLGNVRPDNTSALMVLQQNAEVPLENTRAGLYEWLEDIGAILLDMMGTYYGQRPMVRDREFEEIVTDPATGMPTMDPMTGMMRVTTVKRRVMVDYDFKKLKKLWFNVRVNAGAATYFSEIAMIQTLDNLRKDGVLDVINYLERIPDRMIPRKAELISELKERASEPAADQGAMQTGQGGNNPLLQGVPKTASTLDARRNDLPEAAKRMLPTVG